MKILRAFLVLAAGMLLATARADANPQEMTVNDSNRNAEEFVSSASQLVNEVRFNETDVKAMIAYWDEMKALGGEEEQTDEEDVDTFASFEGLFDSPTYQSWAKSKGLDPAVWMKKFLRIQLMLMKDAIDENAEMTQAIIQFSSLIQTWSKQKVKDVSGDPSVSSLATRLK